MKFNNTIHLIELEETKQDEPQNKQDKKQVKDKSLKKYIYLSIAAIVSPFIELFIICLLL